MKQLIVYVLVFAAVTSVLWVVWSTAVAAGLAESEKRDFENNLRADGRQKTPLERFVSPGRLFRLQLAFSLIPGFLTPILFLLGGMDNVWLPLAFACFTGFAGWKLTRLYFMMLVQRRQAAFESRMLDLAAGLANALKAGMAFPQALERISSRMSGAMKEELAIVQREYRLGLDMADALDRLVERMPCEDMKLLSASVRLTTKTGGSLSDVLGEMAEMIRGRRDFAEKLKTLTAQGKFEGMVLGGMPIAAFVIFYLLQPDMMGVLFQSTAGWTAIGVVIILESLGFITIAKITKIEV